MLTIKYSSCDILHTVDQICVIIVQLIVGSKFQTLNLPNRNNKHNIQQRSWQYVSMQYTSEVELYGGSSLASSYAGWVWVWWVQPARAYIYVYHTHTKIPYCKWSVLGRASEAQAIRVPARFGCHTSLSDAGYVSNHSVLSSELKPFDQRNTYV